MASYKRQTTPILNPLLCEFSDSETSNIFRCRFPFFYSHASFDLRHLSHFRVGIPSSNCIFHNLCHFLICEMESFSGRELVTIASLGEKVIFSGGSMVEQYTMAEEPIDYERSKGLLG